MDNRFDLHTHSCFSDGSFRPAEIVRAAKEAGVRLLALTDHDGVEGVPEAVRAGEETGVTVLPGIEFDCACAHELHILGLGLDTENEALLGAVAAARARRDARNEKILHQLLSAGYDIRPYLADKEGSVARLHIALALMDAGLAASLKEAFNSYLKPGCIGFVDGFRESCIQPEEAIRIIHAAGGMAVWAHPAHTPTDVHKLTDRLAGYGLDGIEAFHPSASEGDNRLLLSLSAQYKLRVTCGSDFHGAYRPGVQLGCTWRNCTQLNSSYAYFMQ